jgi:hypothetical protein
MKSTPPTNQNWQQPSSPAMSMPSKVSAQQHYRPSQGSKVNSIDDRIDMEQNRENSYQRSQATKQEYSYSKRTHLDGTNPNDNHEQRSQSMPSNPPATINVHTNETIHAGGSRQIMAIPLSEINFMP